MYTPRVERPTMRHSIYPMPYAEQEWLTVRSLIIPSEFLRGRLWGNFPPVLNLLMRNAEKAATLRIADAERLRQLQQTRVEWKGLTAQELEAFNLIHGINGDIPMSRGAIARLMGIRKPDVRTLEERAIRKIHPWLRTVIAPR